jgi:hypothetical protein
MRLCNLPVFNANMATLRKTLYIFHFKTGNIGLYEIRTVNRRHQTDSHRMSRIRFPIGSRKMTSVLLNAFRTGGSLERRENISVTPFSLVEVYRQHV